MLHAAPPNDAHLPRAARAFPFIALSEHEAVEVREEIDRTIRGIDAMLHRIVRDEMNPAERVHRAEIDDVVQAVRCHLWAHALPRFDARRGTKVTSFCFHCALNFIRGELRARRGRQRRGREQTGSMAAMRTTAAPDALLDRLVEQVADAVIENPRRFGLHKREAAVLNAILNAPRGRLKQTIAKRLGYANPSTLSVVQKRIRQRLDAIDLDVDALRQSDGDDGSSKRGRTAA